MSPETEISLKNFLSTNTPPSESFTLHIGTIDHLSSSAVCLCMLHVGKFSTLCIKTSAIPLSHRPSTDAPS